MMQKVLTTEIKDTINIAKNILVIKQLYIRI